MRQTAGNIRQRVKMRRRGQQDFASGQIDHAGKRQSTEGAVDRHFDKVDFLQLTGHRQIGNAILQHYGDVAGTGGQAALGQPCPTRLIRLSSAA